MTLSRALTTSSVLAIIAGPALADLTAEDVLADQLSQMALYGLTVQTQGESRSGNVLTVDGLTAAATIPGEDINVILAVGGATYTEQGDGSVLVTYPDEIPMVVQISAPGEDDIAVELTMRQSGMQSLVTGSTDQFRYEFSGESASINDLTIEGPADVDDVDLDITFDMTGFLGVMNIAGGDVRPYDFDMTLGAIKMLFDASGLEDNETFKMVFDVSDIAARYTGTLAQQNLMDSFAKAIENGNTILGSFSHGTASYDVDVVTPDGGIQAAANMASGSFDFTMNERGIDYGGTTDATTITVGGSAIPFPPMTFEMAQYGGRFKFPVVPSEDSQDFAMSFSLVDVIVDPIIWSMFDPGEQLPRDPATIIIDTSGEVVMLQDVFDPAFAETMGQGEAVGEISALDVNEIKVSLAGIELVGDGALSFNNDGPIPVPAGIMNLALSGGNTLLDTLVGMGLLPEEQAMGARMMSGLFARPGDGPDTLVSTIEMKEDGSVLANGQRIK